MRQFVHLPEMRQDVYIKERKVDNDERGKFNEERDLLIGQVLGEMDVVFV